MGDDEIRRPASSSPGYADHARARWVDDPPKDDARTPFARDRARVLHSAALRRLAAKTQVVGPGESDFPRTRLTHTLEVAQIGRDLGAAVGCDPDVVETACLAHDLGHPPFGHNGESALDEAARSCGGFEGNAQTLRVLTRLEAKSLRADGTSAGLNLTRASLDASTKYPWPRREGQQKFGVYEDDLEVFTWLRDGAAADARCLEAQVMDWADDVAYSVHDVEDALHAGHVRLEQLSDAREQDAVAADVVAQGVDAGTGEVQAAFERLVAQQWWPSSYDGSLRSLAGLKNLTSQLIGRFYLAAERATHEAFGARPLARYDAELVVPRETRVECEVLKAVARRYVMQRDVVQRRYAREREALLELVGALVLGAPVSLDSLHAAWWRAATDDAARLRVVLDQVASLTDTSAWAWHRRLVRGEV